MQHVRVCNTIYYYFIWVNSVWKERVSDCDLWRSVVTFYCFLSLKISYCFVIFVSTRAGKTAPLSELQWESQVQIHQSLTRYTEQEGDRDEERHATLSPIQQAVNISSPISSPNISWFGFWRAVWWLAAPKNEVFCQETSSLQLCRDKDEWQIMLEELQQELLILIARFLK